MTTSREDNDVPDVDEVPVSGFRVLVAGLAMAGGTMLVAEMFMVLVLRSPELLLIGAPLTVAFLLTAGALVAWALDRVTRGLDQRKASLAFFGAGLVAGALWGYPVFLVAINSAAQVTGEEPARSAAIAGALYAASTAGLGALAGRYFGPWLATRPQLVRTIGGTVLLVALVGVAVLTLVDLGAVE